MSSLFLELCGCLASQGMPVRDPYWSLVSSVSLSSLWLLCADRTLLEGRKVTCAHNIICDVENAGADVLYGDDGTVGSVVYGDLITAKHPAFTDELLDLFLKEIESV